LIQSSPSGSQRGWTNRRRTLPGSNGSTLRSLGKTQPSPLPSGRAAIQSVSNKDLCPNANLVNLIRFGRVDVALILNLSDSDRFSKDPLDHSERKGRPDVSGRKSSSSPAASIPVTIHRTKSASTAFATEPSLSMSLSLDICSEWRGSNSPFIAIVTNPLPRSATGKQRRIPSCFCGSFADATTVAAGAGVKSTVLTSQPLLIGSLFVAVDHCSGRFARQ
jgi:hypothetical protein